MQRRAKQDIGDGVTAYNGLRNLDKKARVNKIE